MSDIKIYVKYPFKENSEVVTVHISLEKSVDDLLKKIKLHSKIISLKKYYPYESTESSDKRLPYIINRGRVLWNVRYTDCTLSDFFMTHKIKDNIIHIEIVNELQKDIDYYQNCFNNLKELLLNNLEELKIQNMTYHRAKKDIKQIERYSRKNRINPFSIIYLIYSSYDVYLVKQFKDFLVINKTHQALSILRILGYKGNNKLENFIQEETRHRINQFIDQAELFSIYRDYSQSYPLKYKVNKLRVSYLSSLGSFFCNRANKIRSSYSNHILWNSPIKAERKDRFKLVVIAFLVSFLMIAIISIMYGLTKYIKLFGKNTPDLSWGGDMIAFWGSVIGSIIAGVISVITTYLIISKDHRIDFHRERLSVLPAINMRYVKHDTKRNVKVYEVKNVGLNTAFDIVFHISDMEFESIKLGNLAVGEKHIDLLHDNFNDQNDFYFSFYDVHGNFYNQVCTFGVQHSIDIKQPELILKTDRYRYTQ